MLSENLRVLVLQWLWRHVKPVLADRHGITLMEADFPFVQSAECNFTRAPIPRLGSLTAPAKASGMQGKSGASGRLDCFPQGRETCAFRCPYNPSHGRASSTSQTGLIFL